MIALTGARVIFGGTFDPIHNGHLRAAIEIGELLGVTQVELIPARDPVHRDAPGAGADDRLNMLKLAIEGEPHLSVNAVELNTSRASYTLHTLETLRDEMGWQCPLILVMGMDAFRELETWYGWQQLLDYCHILVLRRPGYLPHLSAVLSRLHQSCGTEQPDHLLNSPAGKICFFEQTPLEVSATQVRDRISSGHNPRYLIPNRVWDYIQEKGLYGFERTKDN